MGLTITPYRVRESINHDMGPRSQLFYVQNSLRPVTATVPVELSPPFEINARSLRNTQFNQSSLSNVEQRQFRQQSLLASPFLVTQDIRKMNNESNQNMNLSPNMFNRSFHRRSCSSAK